MLKNILVLLSIYNDQVVSTCFQTVEHSEVVKKVVLAVILKLNDLVMNKNHRDQTQFSPEKKTLEKEKLIYYYLHIRYLLLRRKINKTKKTNKLKI